MEAYLDAVTLAVLEGDVDVDLDTDLWAQSTKILHLSCHILLCLFPSVHSTP